MAAVLIWRPLEDWSGPETAGRLAGPFSAPRKKTEALLAREAGMLGAARAIVQVDATPRSFTQSDRLAYNALVTFPGVVVSLDSRHGPLRYAADTFDHWLANLRAIALALEALRAVDRYGVSKSGEQYRGWSALPAGTHRDVTALFTTAEEARRFVDAALGREWAGLPMADKLRMLTMRMHPDAPEGDREQWERLQAAKALLVVGGKP